MRGRNIEPYKQQLLALRSRLTGEVYRMVEAVREDIIASGNASNLPIHLADQATEGLDTEVDLIKNERGILAATEEALGRIEKGTYGRCENCGTDIPDARLEALPYTPFCVKCAAAGAQID